MAHALSTDEKQAACKQYSGTDQKTCESEKDSIYCDWDNNIRSCFEELGGNAPTSTNLRAFVDNAEDFNIHFRLNWASKPEYVLGHSNIGQVLPNFEHVKIQNSDKNRFEINMSRIFLPPDRDTSGTTTYHDNQGVAQSYPVSLLMSAGTIAHEMMHQMGIRHTVNPATKKYFQDDFVYTVGNCVESNFISNYEWNDIVAF